MAVPEQRTGRKEALFREVNEHVSDVSAGFDGGEEFDLLCECADEACKAAIALSREEYERVRSDPRQFVILPGHDVPDVELVLTEGDRYAIVRKVGEAGRLAEATDPRRR